MKQCTKCVMLVLTAATVLSSATAQISTGFTIGAVQTRLHSDFFKLEEAGTNLSLGLYFALPIQDYLDFSTNVSFQQKSAAIQSTHLVPEGGLALTSYPYTFKVFESQALLVFKPTSWCFVEGGAYINAMSNTMEKDVYTHFVGDFTKSYRGMVVSDLNEAFSGMDYGPVLGIGVGSPHLRFCVQYSYGLKNLYNNISVETEPQKLHASGLKATATYMFTLN